MKYDQHLVTKGWEDYELLDSGDNEKLERFGSIVLARPETEALWKKSHPELWNDISARFAFGDAKGAWDMHTAVPDSWTIAWHDARASLKLGSFKHTGIFPEQAGNWQWIAERVRTISRRLGTVSEGARNRSDSRGEEAREPAILNLFGYTGIASVVAAQAGAFVTHVDASKQSLDWAHENARLSGLPDTSIRWMLDDALAFARREVRRGAKYDGIILDPPAFGRGAKGEVWKIEESLPELLDVLKELLAETPGSFFLLNGYAAGYSPLSFAQAVESTFGEVDGESGELRLAESSSTRAIPAGIYVRFTR
jgi:23S rRNA (cytosine1962-C5)-methyltransferase